MTTIQYHRKLIDEPKPQRKRRLVEPSPNAIYGSIRTAIALFGGSATKLRQLIKAGHVVARRERDKTLHIYLPSYRAYLDALPIAGPGIKVGPGVRNGTTREQPPAEAAR